MTSPTSAGRRDFSVDAGRLLSEECRHGRFARKHKCRSCLAEALTAAYEAGRADAGRPEPKAKSCHCGVTPAGEDPRDYWIVSCGCCNAKAGEPCRHEVKP